MLCCQNIVCRTLSIKRHFETKHEKSFKDDAEKIKSLKKGGISLRKAKQHFQGSDFWRQIEQPKVATKLQSALLNVENRLLMEYLQKKAFLSYADVLFDDLLNKSIIISRIRDMPVSARKIERRITDIAKDVNNQQTIALKTANVFSVALDESIDINDNLVKRLLLGIAVTVRCMKSCVA